MVSLQKSLLEMGSSLWSKYLLDNPSTKLWRPNCDPPFTELVLVLKSLVDWEIRTFLLAEVHLGKSTKSSSIWSNHWNFSGRCCVVIAWYSNQFLGRPFSFFLSPPLTQSLNWWLNSEIFSPRVLSLNRSNRKHFVNKFFPIEDSTSNYESFLIFQRSCVGSRNLD
jgi:hypothetical protein